MALGLQEYPPPPPLPSSRIVFVLFYTNMYCGQVLFCFLSFVSFVLRHLNSGRHRRNHRTTDTRLKNRTLNTRKQDFTWNILWQLHMLPKSGDSLAQFTPATKVIRQVVLLELMKPSTFPRPKTASCGHARGKFLHMSLRKVIYT